MKKIFYLWFLLEMLWWPQIAFAAHGTFHLSPNSIFQRVNLSSEQDPRLSPILAHALGKRIRLGEDALLVRILSDKQIAFAQRSLVIMKHSLDDSEYLKRFIHAWIDLVEAARWFDLSPQALAELLGTPIGESHLLYTSRALWEHLQRNPSFMQYETSAYVPLQSSYVKSDATMHQPSASNYLSFLDHLIQLENAKRYNLDYRAVLWNTDSTKTREDTVSELSYVLEDIISSSSLSQTAYQYFRTLQRYWVIPLMEVERARLKNMSETRRHVIRNVQKEGSITYDRYLDIILRDHVHGFYTRERDTVLVRSHAAGDGEFVTMPQQHPDFGRGVALDLFRMWNRMGRPKEFEVREMGAGEGALALSILKATNENTRTEGKAWKKFRDALRYTILDISLSAIKRQKRVLKKMGDRVTWIQADANTLDSLFAAGSFQGVWISNELPDTFGVHKVKCMGGKIFEITIAQEQGILVETAGPVSDLKIIEHLQRFGGALEEGEERIVDLKTLGWLEAMEKILKKGYIMIFDYGEHYERNRLVRHFASLMAFGRGKERHQAHYVSEEDKRFLQDSRIAFEQAIAGVAGQRLWR